MEVLIIISIIVCLIPLFVISGIFLKYRKMFKALKNAQSGTDLDSLIESFMGKGAKDSPMMKEILGKLGKKEMKKQSKDDPKKPVKKSGPIEYSKNKSDQFEDAEFRDS
jgi:hypothetical protein